MCSMALDYEHFVQESFFWSWFVAQLEQEDHWWWQRFLDTNCNNHCYIFAKILETYVGKYLLHLLRFWPINADFHLHATAEASIPNLALAG